MVLALQAIYQHCPPFRLHHTAAANTVTAMVSFLDLAPEIRNRIYELAIPSDRIIAVESRSGEWFEQLEPGITRTCRQIRSECLAAWYQSNYTIDSHCRFWRELGSATPKVAGMTDRAELEPAHWDEQRRATRIFDTLLMLYMHYTLKKSL